MSNRVECPQSVLEKVIKHVNSTTDSEVGGVLVGKMSEGSTVVTAAIPAEKASAGSANVTFTHEVWEEVLPIIDRDHPDESMVGWYHSHPGFGVFLSEYDLFIQQNFFSDPAMVALVIDPLKGDGGWFEWQNGQVVQSDSFETPAVRSNREVQAQVEQASSNRRSSIVIGVAVAAFVSLIIGYFAGSSLAPKSKEVAETSSVDSAEQIRLLEAEKADLQKRLREATSMVEFESCTYSYTVKPGESFWLIARQQLGDGTLASALKALNPELATTGLDPNDVVKIPATGCAKQDGTSK
ncbi:MAG: Mov34/MPN/PAD-1 family protein [Actinomycetia bacterium]|nr:Mov34/MPN/PAD-1 family protein [Actinomycetes bacterium]